MIEFLKAFAVEWENIGENKRKGQAHEVFINIKQIMTLKDISTDPVSMFSMFRSCISTGNDVYYSELSLDILLEKCDIEVVE